MTIKIGTTTTPFVQPVLTSNGVMGGSSFAVAASTEWDSTQAAWKAFSKVSPGWQCSWEGLPAWLAWYNPVPIKVTEIQGKNRINEPQWVDGVYDYTVQYSNDNSTWTSLQEGRNNNGDSGGSWTISLTAHSVFAKYWRLLITSTTNGRPVAAIGEITVSGVNEGSVPVRSIYFGDQPIQGVCVGSDLIWGFIGFEPLPYQGTTITVHPGKVYGKGMNKQYQSGSYQMFELSSTKTITITWSADQQIGYYVMLGDDGNLYQDFSSLPDGVYGKQIIGCTTNTSGSFSVPPHMSIKHREGLNYYKWSNPYGGALYTEDRIPDVMTYQVVGDGLYETLRILSISGDTITTHSNSSNDPVLPS